MERDKKVLNAVIKTTICVILVIYALSILFPLIWGLLTSLKSNLDFQAEGNVLGLPSLKWSKDELFLKNYKIIVQNFNFKRSIQFYTITGLRRHDTSNNLLGVMLNTLIYAGVGSFLQSVVPALVAYACAKFPYKLSKVIYSVALFMMIMPLVGTYPAEISLLRGLGLYDTFLGYFLQKMNFSGMYFFVYYAFFQTLPDSYVQAAEVDGASQFRILIQIILPLAMIIISSVMLIQFVHFWNDYQTPLLYMPTKPTLAYGIWYMTFGNTAASQLGNKELAKLPVKIAGCMLLAIPIIAIFVLLKDKLMGNLSMGGLKG